MTNTARHYDAQRLADLRTVAAAAGSPSAHRVVDRARENFARNYPQASR